MHLNVPQSESVYMPGKHPDRWKFSEHGRFRILREHFRNIQSSGWAAALHGYRKSVDNHVLNATTRDTGYGTRKVRPYRRHVLDGNILQRSRRGGRHATGAIPNADKDRSPRVLDRNIGNHDAVNISPVHRLQ